MSSIVIDPDTLCVAAHAKMSPPFLT